MNAEELSRRLSRGTRRASAKVHFVDERPFGPALQVRRWRLGNGLDIATLVDPAAPVAAFQSWYRVGSRHEEQGKTGLAHFLEHLMFGETKRFPEGAFDQLLDEVGAENNAATWTDWTCYHENLPSAQLPLAIELEADRMANLRLKKSAVASEREVVASERRDRVDDDVDGKASEVLWHLAFGKRPYGHPTLGWMEDIQGYTVADCKAFYRRWYAPNQALLTFAGDIDEAAVLEMVQQAYGSYRPSEVPAEVKVSPLRQRRERRQELHLECASERFVVGYPAPPVSQQDWLALTMIGEMLFGGRSARCYRDWVLERECATSAWVSLPPFMLQGLFEVGATLVEGGKAEDVLALFDEAIAKVCDEGFTEAEIERTRNRMELGLLSSLETASGKADTMGFFQTALGDPSAIFSRLETYRSLDADTLRRVAQKTFQPSRRSVVFVRQGDAQ